MTGDAPGQSAAWRARLGRVLPPIVFVACPALLILPQLGRGRFLFGHDVTMGFYHTYDLIGRSLASGRLPLWNPHALCGMPLLAGVHNAVLYPPTWLTLFLRPGAFWTISVALHFSLSGFFAWAWLHRGLGLGPWGSLVGACCFMLSGFVSSHVFGGHLSIVATVPWVAGVLWRVERLLFRPGPRRAILVAVFLALMVLAGHPQTAQIGLLAIGARLVHHVLESSSDRRGRLRTAGLAVASLVAGALLAAPQILPTLELTGQTQRTTMNNFEFSSSYSLPPECLSTFIVPWFFGNSTTVPYWGRWVQWELVGFVGISSLSLAAIGVGGTHRQRFLWLGLAVFGLLLAMGHHTPVFPLFFNLVPGAGLFRVPARYVFLLTLGVAPLVAMGFDRLWVGDARVRNWASAGAAAAGVLLVADLGLWMALRAPDNEPPKLWRSILRDQADVARGQRDETYLSGPIFEADSLRLAKASLAAGALTLAAILASLLSCLVWRSAGAAATLGSILVLELLAFDTRLITGHKDEEVHWPDSFVELARSHKALPFRLTTVSEGEIDGVGKCVAAKLDHAGGYDPMMLRRMVELERTGNGTGDTGYAALVTPRRPGPIPDLLGVRYWFVPGPPRPPPGWANVGQIGPNCILENPGALPRAFLVRRKKAIASDADRLRALSAPGFDPAAVVVVESGQDEILGGDDKSPGEVHIESQSPGFYELRVRSASGGWLVLTEAHYPGWEARVDGVPTEILRADHALQTVRITPGGHTVRFEYRSKTLSIGIAVSALTAILWVGLLARVLARRANPQAYGTA